jgi:uncharacterized protein (TIGR03067 family)
MRHLLAIALCVVLFAVGSAQDNNDDAQRLQGTWLLTELVVGGVKVPEKEYKGTTFVFAGNKLSIVPPKTDAILNAQMTAFAIAVRFPVIPETDNVVDRREFTFKIDPTKKPAQVDVTAGQIDGKSVVSPGLYELQGDTLRWCQSDDENNKERPKSFASPEKSRIYLFTFKRVKQ